MIVAILIGLWFAFFFYIHIRDGRNQSRVIVNMKATESLLEKRCSSSDLRAKVFSRPFQFYRGVQFSIRNAIQMAVHYDPTYNTDSQYVGMVQCLFRDQTTGMILHIHADHHITKWTFLADEDDLLSVLGQMNIDLDRFFSTEFGKCRFVPNTITRELITASRGLEPITDEQWKAMTTS